MAKGPTREELLHMLEAANEEKAELQNLLTRERTERVLVEQERDGLGDRLVPLERKVEDLAIIQESRIAQNQALGVYHAFMSGKVSLEGQSLLLMHLLATNPREFVNAARKAGLGNFFLNLTTDLEERVLVELRNYRKIPAIKLYREATRVGPKEAKEAVEAIGDRNGIPRPRPLY